jgi:hypothetical protein
MSQLASGPIIDIDLSNTPDQVPVPPPAVYSFTVEKMPEVKPSKEPNATTGVHSNVLHLEIKLQNEGDFKGHPLMDWITVSSAQGQVRFKRLLMSTNSDLTPPINIGNLVGKTGYCTVVNSVDTRSGRPIQQAKVGDFLIPGDQGHPAAKK